MLSGFADHARDRGGSAFERVGVDHALRPEALAQPCHCAPIDDHAPPPAGLTFADDELDRVGADIDHRKACRLAVDQRRQAARVGSVRIPAEAEFGHRTGHRHRVLGLDGDGARGLAVHHHVGEFGHAAAHRVARAPLVDIYRADRAVRLGEFFEELLEGVARAGQRWHRQPQGFEHPRGLGRGQRKARLHDRNPLLEPVGIDLRQRLDIHQSRADLHGAACGGQQIQLVALLHSLRRQLGQPALGPAEMSAE